MLQEVSRVTFLAYKKSLRAISRAAQDARVWDFREMPQPPWNFHGEHINVVIRTEPVVKLTGLLGKCPFRWSLR